MAKFRGTHIKPSPTGQTTNAVPTTFDLIDLAAPGFCEAINNQAIHIEMTVIMRVASTGATASGKITGVAKRVAGILTFMATSAAVLLGDFAATGVFLPIASGSKLQVTATGIALTTINWTFHTTLWTD